MGGTAMTITEIHFRLITVREQLTHISEELEDIEQNLKTDSALLTLERAARGLTAVENDLRAVATLENPEAMLALSVASNPRHFKTTKETTL
jgi:hypothetical protein